MNLDQMHASEALFRATFDQASVGISRSAVNGQFVQVNQALCTLLGYTEQELLTRTPREVTYPADIPASEEVINLLLQDQKARSSKQIEKRYLGKDGSVVWVLAAISLIRDATGKPSYFITVIQDISTNKEAEERFRATFNQTAVGIAHVSRDGHYIETNAYLSQLLGYSSKEFRSMTTKDVIHPDDLATVLDNRRRLDASEREAVVGEIRYIRKDGSVAWVNRSVSVVRDPSGRAKYFISMVQDITERKRGEDALRESEARFRSLTAMSSDFYWETDVEHRFVRGTTAADLNVSSVWQAQIGKRRWDTPYLSPDEVSWRAHRELLDAHIPFRDFQLSRIGRDGAVRHLSVSGDPVFDAAGIFTGYRGVGTDITERKAAVLEIEHLAFYDSLTNLPNRRLLLDRLKQALATSTRSGREGAILFIDLDNFKDLNDTRGHDKGDLLLQHVAQRLITCIREGDTVARIGGDEFVVMLEDLSESPLEAATQAEAIGEKILAILSAPYTLDGNEIHSTPSIGITLFADHQDTVDELLKRADLAMYQAKAAGRNTLRFFDPDMQAIVSARAVLETNLRQGLGEHQFLLYYQPQMDRDGQLTGAEALVRWQHPRRGLVAPDEFIPLAEATGLILPLGKWVLEAACSQLVSWAAQMKTAHLSLSVNVSARQFRHPDFVDEVLAILAHTGADPHKLKLELTESLLLDDVEDTIAKMMMLKERGVGFSLDDFGTGYSSLSYLKRLPLYQLKIDKFFVRDVLTDPNNATIAKMIIALAESMGLTIIAEGVEIEAQRDFLASSGCHAYQGFLFSHPLPLEAFEAFVRTV